MQASGQLLTQGKHGSRYLAWMRIDGNPPWTSDRPFGLYLLASSPLSPDRIEALAKLSGVPVLSVSVLVAGKDPSRKDQIRKWWKHSREGKAESTILLHDIPDDSPLRVLAIPLERFWVRQMVRSDALLVPAIWSGEGEETTLRIARPVPTDMIGRIGGRARLRRHLLAKARLMDSALEWRAFYPATEQDPGVETPPEAQETEYIRKEIERLNPSLRMCAQGVFEVWIASAEQIPHTLKEIGRLREITFRSVGEGTGKAIDLDEYDLYYDQLILWDKEIGRVAGGYRIGRGDRIFDAWGPEGFYIHSLFRIGVKFHALFPKALELGRSYIVPEYQKHRLPLFLLWKGILRFLQANPSYRFLYGPVSISSQYTDISRGLIIEFLREHYFDRKRSRWLKPRKAFRVALPKKELGLLAKATEGDLDLLNGLVEDIEPGHLKIPVLVRQYLRQNARFIGFNLDPHFSDALDGFILLDLKDVPQETIDALNKADQPA